MELNLEAVKRNFNTIKWIVNSGIETLNENMLDNGIVPTAQVDRDQQKVRIPESSHASAVIKSILGRIKLELASSLTLLQELQAEFENFLGTNLS